MQRRKEEIKKKLKGYCIWQSFAEGPANSSVLGQRSRKIEGSLNKS